MNKVLFIVGIKSQLLQCIHIKRSLLKDCYADAVLLGGQFDTGYVERLYGIFDHVWWVESEYYSQRDFLKFFLCPERAIRSKLDEMAPVDYSDIYNWNPGYLMYYYRKTEMKYKHKFCWHLLQDGEGNYVFNDMECVVDYPRRNILERLIHLYEMKIQKLFPLVYDDEYLWKPILRVVPYSHKVVELSCIDTEDTNYVLEINRIFGFVDMIAEKIIFVDAYPDTFSYYSFPIIRELSKKYGKDNVVVFMHPNVDRSDYGELSKYANFKENMVPWEVICLNGGTKGKIIVGVVTSALVMGYVSCNDDAEVFCFAQNVEFDKLNRVYEGFEEILAKGKDLYNRMELINPKFHNVDSVDEIVM